MKHLIALLTVLAVSVAQAQPFEPLVSEGPYRLPGPVLNPGLLHREQPVDAERQFLDFVPELVRRTTVGVLDAFPEGLRLGTRTSEELNVSAHGTFGFDGRFRLLEMIDPAYDVALLFEQIESSISVFNSNVERFAHDRFEWMSSEDGSISIGVLPEIPMRPGQIFLQWENIAPTNLPNLDDAPTNTYQAILTHVGGGDADLELRYERCEWAVEDGPRGELPPYAIMAFNINEGADGVVQQWASPFAASNRMLQLCLLTNSDRPGVWRYQIRDGLISGCGLPFDGHDPGDGRCSDGNLISADGCSMNCLIERDTDNDGFFEPPAGGILNADGTPYDPLGVYDHCLFDACDDTDGDNVPDVDDNCPEVFNPPPSPGRHQANQDGDFDGDACDDDDDRDSLPDDVDLCPLAFDYVPHPSFELSLDQPTWRQPNDDGDALANRCDPDDDNDGVLDCGDDGICPFPYDGVWNGARQRLGNTFPDGETDIVGAQGDLIDNDSDGYVDEFGEAGAVAVWRFFEGPADNEDNCRTIPNPGQEDFDADFVGDACDDDSDGDGVANCGDDGFCRYARDLRDNDNDGAVDEIGECGPGAPCDAHADHVDNDGDGIIDERPGEPMFAAVELVHQSTERSDTPLVDAPHVNAVFDDDDNCILVPNRAQTDVDGDGIGDACDDDDGDGVPVRAPDLFGAPGGLLDNCPDTPNPDQIDTNMDGEGDACDPDIDGDGFLNDDDLCPVLATQNQEDLDMDGVGDACDDDLDGDTVTNLRDNCSSTPNPGQEDTDNDTAGDACDPDDDNDDTLDGDDNCPLTANAGQADLDDDGIGDLCDVDDDGDGVDDDIDNCPRTANPDQINTDRENRARDESLPPGDAQGDACDLDDDNDNVGDGEDLCPLTPDAAQADFDQDGRGNACDPDDDNDGVPDDRDNCLLNDAAGLMVDIADQTDTDGDLRGDICDPDDDGDQAIDGEDNCPKTPNPEQLDLDLDGLGDACDPDADGDDRLDADDNCPLVPNPEQDDADGDNAGDACDDDDDNDGVLDGDDNCRTVPNRDQRNTDGGPRPDPSEPGDACDDDDDGDGTNDMVDNCPLVFNRDQRDTDGDFNPDDPSETRGGDACDLDDDGDNVPDVDDNCPLTVNVEQADFDGDGRGDACTDTDEDGIDDDEDNCPIDINPNQRDSDSDGLGDECDPFDGRPDDVERCRAENAPILWAKVCRSPTKKVGCTASPGSSTDATGWWLLGLLALRRRRR